MAKQITQLPVAASVAASDVFPLDQSGTTKQATLTTIAAGLPAGTGTGGLVRQTNPSFDGSVAVEDPALPFFQTNNTSAPADKKFTRFSHSATGAVQIERVNDAYTVATPLITWDASNNAQFSAPVSVNSGSANLATLSGSPGVGAFCGARIICADSSTVNLRTAFIDICNENTISVSSIQSSVNIDGGSNIRFIVTSPGDRAIDRRVEIVRIRSDGNVGIGTTDTSSKLGVAGDIRLMNNGTNLFFTDTGGTTPYMVSAVDGNFYFTGTTAAGAGRGIFQCAMRSDTSPLQISVPLKIGASGASISTVLTAVATLSPPAIAANGGVQFLDVTVTGATNSMVCMVECPGGLSNNSIIVKANHVAADTVRVYFVNPTASSVTLTSAIYRIACIKF